MLISKKIINADMDLFGFKIRTRRHYKDDHIIRSCLDESVDCYKLPKKLDFVIDIGANIGCISLVAARRGANVLSFEPATDNFQTLEHNIRVNGYNNKVRCINLGVGEPGETKLYIHPKNSGATSSKFVNNGMIESDFEMVNFITIKDVFKNYNVEHCDLLKLDCEGSEYEIIRDFDDELAEKVDQISVEMHYKGSIRQDLINKLMKWYKVEHLRRYEYCFRK